MQRLIVGWILVCAACAPGTRSSPKPTVTVATIKSELARDRQIDHALSRLTYGARPGDAQRVSSIGLERWIALQLSPERVDDRVADSVGALYRAMQTPTSELVAAFREVREARRIQQMDSLRRPEVRPIPAPGAMDSRRDLQLALGEVAASKLMRAVVSERQLYEQMVDFWENHFSVFSGKGNTRLFIPAYDREVIRPLAMGRFRELLGAVAKSPAMLFYLDNAQSVADSGRRTLVPFRRPARGPGQSTGGLTRAAGRPAEGHQRAAP